MPSKQLILYHALLLTPSIFPSIRVFSNESALRIRWPKYWSFSFSISPSNEHSGLISFRMDWLDLLAVQGTLKSLLQHHRSKTSILHHSTFERVTGGKARGLQMEEISCKCQTFLSLLSEMAPHSSTLAWRIPWREEPGRLQSMGSQGVGHDWGTSLHLSGRRKQTSDIFSLLDTNLKGGFS